MWECEEGPLASFLGKFVSGRGLLASIPTVALSLWSRQQMAGALERKLICIAMV